MTKASWRRVACALGLLTVAGYRLDAQVTYERILKAAAEPHNWLTYSGGYSGNRYSLLRQIAPGNVANLELKWIFQGNVLGAWQSTPPAMFGSRR